MSKTFILCSMENLSDQVESLIVAVFVASDCPSHLFSGSWHITRSHDD